MDNYKFRLKSFYARIPFEDYTLLYHAVEILEGNATFLFGDPKPWSPFRGIKPSNLCFDGVWNWDCAFAAIGILPFDPELAKEQIEMFIHLQQPSGLFPDLLNGEGRLYDRYGKPPVLSWAAERIVHSENDFAWARKVYPAFRRNTVYWENKRYTPETGLFFYDSETDEPEQRDLEARWESGWDNAVRWDPGILNIYPIDLNCYMTMNYRALSYLAERAEDAVGAAEYRQKAERLALRIETAFWSEREACYYDLRRDFVHTGVLSPASFMPLFIGSASPERASRMAEYAADPRKMYPGFPSVSYDSPQFDPEGYWRGRTWLNIAWFALTGLKRYGFDKIADECRKTILDWVRADIGGINENYNPLTGKPLGVPRFSWSAAFVILFLLAWEDNNNFTTERELCNDGKNTDGDRNAMGRAEAF